MKKLNTGEEKTKKQVRFQTREVDDVIEILSTLKIENIQNDQLLPDSQPIISIVESILHDRDNLARLNNSIETLDRLDKKENANYSLLWASLINNNIHPKALVSVLIGLIENHKSKVSFIASTIYLNLIILRGSEGYSIFDPVALNSIYNLIKSWIYCYTSNKERTKTSTDEELLEDEDEETDDRRDMSIFTYDEVDSLLRKYFQFISLITLEYDSQGFYDAIDIATEITKIHIHNDEDKSTTKKRKRGSSTSINSNLNAKLWKYGYDILLSIIESSHGENIKSTISVVFKSLLPNILMEDRKVDVKDATVDFISSIMDDTKTYYNSSCQCLVLLMQHICVKLDDNAQSRQHSLTSIERMFTHLNSDCKMTFTRFLEMYSRNKKTLYRLFSLDVASHALQHLCYLETLLEIDQQMIIILLNILLTRSLDKVPNIRSKSLMNISHVMQSIVNVEHMRDMFLDVMFPEVIRSTTTPMKKSNNGGLNLLSIVRKALKEDRANVQRSALHVMEMIGICAFDGVKLTDDDIAVIKERCFDQFVSIRKQGVIALSELCMAYPDSIKLAAAWSLSVPHLIYDTEQSIQDACVKYFKTLIIDRIIEINSNENCVWDVIEVLDNTMNGNKSVLSKIIQFMYDKTSPPKKLITSLQNMIKNYNTLGAWILLSNLSTYSPKDIQIKLIVSKWKEYRKNEKENSKLLPKVLSILNSVSKLMDTSTAKEIETEIKERIESLDMDPSYLNVSLSLLMKITKDPLAWINGILKSSTEALSSCVVSGKSSQNGNNNLSIANIEFHLRLVGELARYTKSVPKPLVNVIEALITPTLKTIVIANSQVVPISESIVAYAFIALGMLCLEDQTLTKSSVPKFIRELEVSNSSTIRNNVMVILCNLCVRYTNIVEGYIGKISLCLKDSNELVRKQTLLLLSSLLQEDYIKPKNENIFFRLILSLVDESPSIQKYSLGCLETLLLKKDSKTNIFFNNFIDVIFYLNDNKLHPKYNTFQQSSKERESFSLKGNDENNRQKRMKIYKIFLDHLPDAMKFQLSYNLCKEILSSIAYEQIPFKGSEEVLYDTLCILISKEIKIKVSSIAKDEQEDLEEEKEDQSKLMDVKTKMINQLVKKNVVENVVPIIIELKHLLAKNHSPLLKNLLEYLKHLLKDYKDEINDILASDRRLASELEYEMKKLDVDANKPKIVPNIINIHRTPISTPRTPRKLSSPSDMSKFSLPKLRHSPSTYQPTPGKPHKEEEEEEESNIENNENRKRKKKRKISIMMSPSIARMKQANIFISKEREEDNNEEEEEEETLHKRKREEVELEDDIGIEEGNKEDEDEGDKKSNRRSKRNAGIKKRSVKVLKSKEEIEEEEKVDERPPLRRSKRTRS